MIRKLLTGLKMCGIYLLLILWNGGYAQSNLGEAFPINWFELAFLCLLIDKFNKRED